MNELDRLRQPELQRCRGIGRKRNGLVTIEVAMFIFLIFPLFVAAVVLTKKTLVQFDHMNAVFAAWPFM